MDKVRNGANLPLKASINTVKNVKQCACTLEQAKQALYYLLTSKTTKIKAY